MRKKFLCLLVFLGLLCGCGASGGNLQEESKEVILNENGKEEIQIAIAVYGLEMQKTCGRLQCTKRPVRSGSSDGGKQHSE